MRSSLSCSGLSLDFPSAEFAARCSHLPSGCDGNDDGDGDGDGDGDDDYRLRVAQCELLSRLAVPGTGTPAHPGAWCQAILLIHKYYDWCSTLEASPSAPRDPGWGGVDDELDYGVPSGPLEFEPWPTTTDGQQLPSHSIMTDEDDRDLLHNIHVFIY